MIKFQISFGKNIFIFLLLCTLSVNANIQKLTNYEYTPSNLLSKTTYPDNTTESKTYDAMDNILSETNKDGYTTSYEYDKAYRLVKTTYPDGTTTSNTYDEAGRVTSTTDENSNTTNYIFI